MWEDIRLRHMLPSARKINSLILNCGGIYLALNLTFSQLILCLYFVLKMFCTFINLFMETPQGFRMLLTRYMVHVSKVCISMIIMQLDRILPTIPNLPCQTYLTKFTMPNLPYQTHHAKPTIPNLPCQTYHTKPTMPNLP
jgi:hypothetical protein